MKKLTLIVIITLFLNSCTFIEAVFIGTADIFTTVAKDDFVLNSLDKTKISVYCTRISEWKTIEQKNENSILLHPKGKVSLGYYLKDEAKNEVQNDFFKILNNIKPKYENLQVFDFGIKKLNEGLVVLHLRTTPDDLSKKGSEFKIEFLEDRVKIMNNGQEILDKEILNYSTNQENRIIIINFGKYIKVSVDCDDIFYGRTDLPLTEYLIIENPMDAEVEINAITVNDEIPNNIFAEKVKY